MARKRKRTQAETARADHSKNPALTDKDIAAKRGMRPVDVRRALARGSRGRPAKPDLPRRVWVRLSAEVWDWLGSFKPHTVSEVIEECVSSVAHDMTQQPFNRDAWDALWTKDYNKRDSAETEEAPASSETDHEVPNG